MTLALIVIAFGIGSLAGVIGVEQLACVPSAFGGLACQCRRGASL